MCISPIQRIIVDCHTMSKSHTLSPLNPLILWDLCFCSLSQKRLQHPHRHSSIMPTLLRDSAEKALAKDSMKAWQNDAGRLIRAFLEQAHVAALILEQERFGTDEAMFVCSQKLQKGGGNHSSTYLIWPQLASPYLEEITFPTAGGGESSGRVTASDSGYRDLESRESAESTKWNACRPVCASDDQ